MKPYPAFFQIVTFIFLAVMLAFSAGCDCGDDEEEEDSGVALADDDDTASDDDDSDDDDTSDDDDSDDDSTDDDTTDDDTTDDDSTDDDDDTIAGDSYGQIDCTPSDDDDCTGPDDDDDDLVIENVTSDVTYETALGLDMCGRPNIAYLDDSTDTTIFAVKEAGIWTPHAIHAAHTSRWNLDMAMDSQGYAHVAYAEFSDKHLWYATNKCGEWGGERADDFDFVGNSMAIALDQNDLPLISYQTFDGDDSFPQLREAKRENGLWYHHLLDECSDCMLAGFNDIAVDAAGNYRIAYRYVDAAGDDVEQLRFIEEGSAFNPLDIGNNITVAPHISLAVDENGFSHISYFRDNELFYFSDKTGTWQNESVDDDPSVVGADTAIAVDENGFVHILYRQWDGEDLRYVTNMTGNWVVAVIDDRGDIGYGASIRLDDQGTVHASYGGDDGLFYARFPMGYVNP